MYKLVLVRHGESTWNLENRFTGWTDVDLTPTGVDQAKNAGRLLKAEGYEFDVAYTSVLKRATRTLWHCLDEMDRTWLPVVHSWRLNERHYGALQGLNKGDMAKQYGDAQVLIWRRSYDTPPPALEATDPRSERGDLRYAKLDRTDFRGADLTNSDLDGASLVGANLTGVTMLFDGREVGCGFTGTYSDGNTEVEGTALVGKTSVFFRANLILQSPI